MRMPLCRAIASIPMAMPACCFAPRPCLYLSTCRCLVLGVKRRSSARSEHYGSVLDHRRATIVRRVFDLTQKLLFVARASLSVSAPVPDPASEVRPGTHRLWSELIPGDE